MFSSCLLMSLSPCLLCVMCFFFCCRSWVNLFQRSSMTLCQWYPLSIIKYNENIIMLKQISFLSYNLHSMRTIATIPFPSSSLHLAKSTVGFRMLIEQILLWLVSISHCRPTYDGWERLKYNIPRGDTFATPLNKVYYFSRHRTYFTNPWLLLVISIIILILARGACNVFYKMWIRRWIFLYDL